MPGIYGSVIHIVGNPTSPKKVEGGVCCVCQSASLCYRQVFESGQGWRYRHYGCDPYKPVIERKYARGGSPMVYVPDKIGELTLAGERTYARSDYDPTVKQRRFDPVLGRTLRRKKE